MACNDRFKNLMRLTYLKLTETSKEKKLLKQAYDRQVKKFEKY